MEYGIIPVLEPIVLQLSGILGQHHNASYGAWYVVKKAIVAPHMEKETNRGKYFVINVTCHNIEFIQSGSLPVLPVP